MENFKENNMLTLISNVVSLVSCQGRRKTKQNKNNLSSKTGV